MKMIYKILDKDGKYLNSYASVDEAYDENERLRRVYPMMKTVVVAEL